MYSWFIFQNIEKKLFKEEIVCFLNGRVFAEAWKFWSFYRDYDLEKNIFELERIENDYPQEVQFLIKFINEFYNYSSTSLIAFSHMDQAWRERISLIIEKQQKNYINLDKYQKNYKKFFKKFEKK